MRKKTIVLLFLVLVGIVLIYVANFCLGKDNFVMSIGSGLFASALCMLVYEIINDNRNFNVIINDLKDIESNLKKYFYYTNQCYKCIKTLGCSPENICLVKNALSVESFKIHLLGNVLLNKIIKYKSDYSFYLSENMTKKLDEVSAAIENNLDFISGASSYHTTNINIERIREQCIDKLIESLQIFLDNRKIIFYDKPKNFIASLREKKNEKEKDELIKSMSKDTKTDEHYQDIKQKLIKGFNNGARENAFFDEKIDLSGEKKFVCSFPIKNDYLEEQEKALIKQLEIYSDDLVYKEFKNNSKLNKIEVENIDCDYVLEVAKKAKVKNKNSRDYFFVESNITDDFKKFKDNLKLSENAFLPYFVWWADNAITFKAECCKEETIFRELNDNEINVMIDRDYSLFNGLYKYAEYSDKSRNVFLTREELFKVLKHKYAFVAIVYKSKVYLNKEGIIIFSQKEYDG